MLDSRALFGFAGAQMKDCIFNQSVQTKQRLASETDLIINALFQRPIPRPFELAKSLVLINRSTRSRDKYFKLYPFFFKNNSCDFHIVTILHFSYLKTISPFLLLWKSEFEPILQ